MNDQYDLRVQQILPPADYPITLQELKDHLRITHNDEDTVLQNTIYAATDAVEQYLNRKLITQVVAAWIDSMPPVSWWSGTKQASIRIFQNTPGWLIRLPLMPTQSVDEIRVWLENDNDEVVPTTVYRVDTVDVDLAARVALRETQFWPFLLRNILSMRITYTVGYGDPEDVPPLIKQGLLMWATKMYVNRGDCEQTRFKVDAPSVLQAYRVVKA